MITDSDKPTNGAQEKLGLSPPRPLHHLYLAASTGGLLTYMEGGRADGDLLTVLFQPIL